MKKSAAIKILEASSLFDTAEMVAFAVPGMVGSPRCDDVVAVGALGGMHQWHSALLGVDTADDLAHGIVENSFYGITPISAIPTSFSKSATYDSCALFVRLAAAYAESRSIVIMVGADRTKPQSGDETFIDGMIAALGHALRYVPQLAGHGFCYDSECMPILGGVRRAIELGAFPGVSPLHRPCSRLS